MIEEIIQPIVDSRVEEIIPKTEQVCSSALDQLELIVKKLQPFVPQSMIDDLLKIENIHIEICVESSKLAYKQGLLDGMEIHEFCLKKQ